jgi:hypothetical protein
LNESLEKILISEEPILAKLMAGLSLDASLKFHKQQFTPIYDTTIGSENNAG